MGYISFPIDATPDEILDEAYGYIKSRSPNWVENDGNLDVWILQAIASEASDLRELARDVPDDIFRYFGSLVAVPPINAVSATVDTTWVMKDNLGYTIPAGTFVTIRDDIGNDVPFQTTIDSIVPVGTTTTAPGGVTLSAVDPGSAASGIGGVGIAAKLLDTLAYVTSVTMTEETSGGVDAETASEYNDRLALRLQLLSNRPILPRDFSIMARDITGVFRSLALDGYSPQHNLLTANEASIETDATAWANTANVTVARSTAQSVDGAASLSLTSVASGDMRSTLNTGNRKAVVAGEVITGLASFRSAVSARSVRVTLNWWNAGGSFISAVNGTSATDATTGWNQVSVTGTAPALAATVSLQVEVLATGAASEVHYADRMLLQRGSDGNWVAGGVASTGIERTVSVACVDENGDKIPPATVTAVDAYLEANREINFVIWEVDPTYSTIQVAVAVHIITGFAQADVSANLVTAATNFLKPSVWGRDPTYTDVSSETTWIDTPILRYNEMMTALSNVEGVDYVSDLQIGFQGGTLVRTDLTLGQPAALTKPGTITPTFV